MTALRSDEFWAAFARDGSVIIPFQTELECLRVAIKRELQVSKCRFGDDLLDLTIVDAEIVDETGTAVTS